MNVHMRDTSYQSAKDKTEHVPISIKKSKKKQFSPIFQMVNNKYLL